MIPGRLLHRLAGMFIPVATRERMIDAQLADFLYEFVRAGSAPQRAMVLVRGYGAFWRMFPLCVVRGVRRESLQPLVRVIAMMVCIAGFACLVASAGSWVRTGSVSWADAWSAATDSRMVANAPLVALAQYCALTRRVSLPAVLIALLTAFGFRLLEIPEESIDHWVVRMTVCMALVLSIPRLLRVGKPNPEP
jgi:hypothetical protein